MKNQEKCTLNFDLSTDSLYWEVLDDRGVNVAFAEINFFSEFHRSHLLEEGHGYIEHPGGVVRISIILIAKAIEKMMWDVSQVLQSRGGVQKIIAMCGGVQQHGMYRLRTNAAEKLRDIFADTSRYMHDSLTRVFDPMGATSWRDSSSRPYADYLLERQNADWWAKLTGSSPGISLRFAGLQLGQYANSNFAEYQQIGQIGVLPSLPALFLTGTVPGMGWDEASCTMMMNIRKRQWARTELKEIYPEGAFDKLPKIVAPGSFVGKLAQYWVERYGFSDECDVLLSPGDNPAAEASANLKPNEWVISFGNSATAYVKLEKCTWDEDHHAHVLLATDGRPMSMYCTDISADFADKVRQHVGRSWRQFDEASTRLERKRIREFEFVIPGDPDPQLIGLQKRHVNRVALALARSLAARIAVNTTFFPRPKRIFLTGGLAKGGLPQIISNMFQAPVVLTKAKSMNRVARGAAVLGNSHAYGRTREEAQKLLCPVGETVHPDLGMEAFYQCYLQGYKLL